MTTTASTSLRRLAGSALWLAALLLPACGGHDHKDYDDDSQPAESASASIDVAGGTVATPSGAQVLVPAGALSAPTTVAIERTSAGAPALPPAFVGAGPMFMLTPHGTTFGVPVTVSIPFDASRLPAATQPSLYKGNATGQWERLPASTVSGNLISAAVTSFSPFGAGVWPATITQHPQSLAVNAGDTASFSVTAVDNPPYTYRWEFSTDAGATWSTIGGATARTYTTAPTGAGDDGRRYRAIVRTDADVVSQAATLTVTTQVIAPAITAQPSPVSVSAGQDATFSVLATGTAPTYQWWIQRPGQAGFDVIPGATNASYTHLAAPLADHDARFQVVVANSAGSVTSNPALLTVNPPVPPGGGSTGARLSAGVDFSVARLADKTLRSWGQDFSGALGEGPTYNGSRSTPGPVLNLGDVVAVDSGGFTSLALRDNGEIWGWGSNAFGQLCTGNLDDGQVPVRFNGSASLGAVTAVSVGASHTLVLAADGHIEACGYNGTHALGNNGAGYLTQTAVRVTVAPGMKPIVAISAGKHFSVALDVDGVVWTWGSNEYGQLGYAAATTSGVPQKVLGIGTVKSLSAGQDHVLAVTTSGEIWSWGSNESGKLGRGPLGASSAMPGRVQLGGAVEEVAAGEQHSVARRVDGTVFTWGNNSAGQLGTGSLLPAMRDVPGPVGSPLPGSIQAIAVGGGSGGGHSLALAADGRVWAWGSNGSGQLGDGTTTTRSTPAPIPALNLN